MSKRKSPASVATGYAVSQKEASTRYSRYKTNDPYPDISEALLNSADIKAYVKKAGLIFPFYENDLQSASYKVRIAGKVVYWKYNDKYHKNKKKNYEKVEINLLKGDGFDLPPNSIAFVTLEPEFRIPDYMALRFNLKIKHIYKGLLLGTGPLVDPGFQGKLSIPLHNLTSNTYHFMYGDTLITMEFTKISKNKLWNNSCGLNCHNEELTIEDIPPSRDVSVYLNNALKNDRLDSVISSIPDALYESKKQVSQAKKDADKMRKTSYIASIGSFIAVCTLVISCITLSINALNKSNDKYDDLEKQYDSMNSQYISEINKLEDTIDELQKEIDKLKGNHKTRE